MVKKFRRTSLLIVVGLTVLTAFVVLIVVSCQNKSSAPSTPETVTTNQRFWAETGDGQFGAWVGKNTFKFSVPAGEYLLTYMTSLGTFYIAFRATGNAVLHIGLQANDAVSEASLKKGQSTGTPANPWVSGPVTLLAWPGGGATAWWDVFSLDPSAAAIGLISGGQVVVGVVTLPAPAPQPAPNPTQPPGGDWKVIGTISPYDPGSRPVYDNTTIFSTNIDPNNPLLATVQTSNGWVTQYYGSKNADNITALNFVCSKTPTGDTITIELDNQTRPVRLSHGDGKIIMVDWNNQTISFVDGYLPCPQAIKTTDIMIKATDFTQMTREQFCSGFGSLVGVACSAWLKVVFAGTGLETGGLDGLLGRYKHFFVF